MTLLLSLSLALASSATPNSQSQSEPPANNAVSDATETDRYQLLDQLTGKAEYLQIGKLLQNPGSQETYDTDMIWLRNRSMNSGSAYFAMMYGAKLWQWAGQVEGPAADQVKQTSVAMFLLTQTIIDIDGARCADRSAPIGRMQKIAGLFPRILEYAQGLDAGAKNMIVAIVMTVENKNAAERARNFDKKFLCLGGMHHIQYGMAHGTVKERPAKEGEFGRQMEVGDGGNYVAPEVDYDKWMEIAGKKRGALDASLRKLLAGKEK